MDRIKVRAAINTLGIHANEHVEIDYTPAVHAKILAGWLVPLVQKDGSRQGIPERD